ncbi:aromatic ring-opening dioxygenase LigA [Galbitalea sp. SE-J8]|uniref:aromatic ring-opening dioxygenase LigA n=1 Tax=Galbitalea sp. SE-J8 TaxID=3054952 RepID=UPI00259C6F96|nr:aromatic ring-opening dioxygenase LigA [Galbitalea sp. SE-J8]MDM4762075.1 aromatic ring-opening dioxygenase LigA [Galbitalea sp. SE-J8]
MTATALPAPAAAAPAAVSTVRLAVVRWIGLVGILAGIVMIAAGGTVWGMVSSQLADQKITVAEDAPFLAGNTVDGPLSAYAQATIINTHALEMSDGKTYAQLDRDDPMRATVMNASFLRASLFTSVVSFGVAAFAMGTGLIVGLLGFALTRLVPATRRRAGA